MFLGSNLYACDFCGFELDWESNDDIHGNMWSCEKCDKIFCSKCFEDRFGKEEYQKMINGEKVLCPDCWEEQ